MFIIIIVIVFLFAELQVLFCMFQFIKSQEKLKTVMHIMYREHVLQYHDIISAISPAPISELQKGNCTPSKAKGGGCIM